MLYFFSLRIPSQFSNAGPPAMSSTEHKTKFGKGKAQSFQTGFRRLPLIVIALGETCRAESIFK
jgi:hypothetical protein